MKKITPVSVIASDVALVVSNAAEISGKFAGTDTKWGILRFTLSMLIAGVLIPLPLPELPIPGVYAICAFLLARFAVLDALRILTRETLLIPLTYFRRVAAHVTANNNALRQITDASHNLQGAISPLDGKKKSDFELPKHLEIYEQNDEIRSRLARVRERYNDGDYVLTINGQNLLELLPGMVLLQQDGSSAILRQIVKGPYRLYDINFLLILKQEYQYVGDVGRKLLDLMIKYGIKSFRISLDFKMLPDDQVPSEIMDLFCNEQLFHGIGSRTCGEFVVDVVGPGGDVELSKVIYEFSTNHNDLPPLNSDSPISDADLADLWGDKTSAPYRMYAHIIIDTSLDYISKVTHNNLVGRPYAMRFYDMPKEGDVVVNPRLINSTIKPKGENPLWIAAISEDLSDGSSGCGIKPAHILRSPTLVCDGIVTRTGTEYVSLKPHKDIWLFIISSEVDNSLPHKVLHMEYVTDFSSGNNYLQVEVGEKLYKNPHLMQKAIQ